MFPPCPLLPLVPSLSLSPDRSSSPIRRQEIITPSFEDGVDARLSRRRPSATFFPLVPLSRFLPASSSAERAPRTISSLEPRINPNAAFRAGQPIVADLFFLYFYFHLGLASRPSPLPFSPRPHPPPPRRLHTERHLNSQARPLLPCICFHTAAARRHTHHLSFVCFVLIRNPLLYKKVCCS